MSTGQVRVISTSCKAIAQHYRRGDSYSSSKSTALFAMGTVRFSAFLKRESMNRITLWIFNFKKEN